jgi:hypothetical protein
MARTVRAQEFGKCCPSTALVFAICLSFARFNAASLRPLRLRAQFLRAPRADGLCNKCPAG